MGHDQTHGGARRGSTIVPSRHVLEAGQTSAAVGRRVAPNIGRCRGPPPAEVPPPQVRRCLVSASADPSAEMGPTSGRIDVQLWPWELGMSACLALRTDVHGNSQGKGARCPHLTKPSTNKALQKEAYNLGSGRTLSWPKSDSCWSKKAQRWAKLSALAQIRRFVEDSAQLVEPRCGRAQVGRNKLGQSLYIVTELGRSRTHFGRALPPSVVDSGLNLAARSPTFGRSRPYEFVNLWPYVGRPPAVNTHERSSIRRFAFRCGAGGR